MWGELEGTRSEAKYAYTGTVYTKFTLEVGEFNNFVSKVGGFNKLICLTVGEFNESSWIPILCMLL